MRITANNKSMCAELKGNYTPETAYDFSEELQNDHNTKKKT